MMKRMPLFRPLRILVDEGLAGVFLGAAAMVVFFEVVVWAGLGNGAITIVTRLLLEFGSIFTMAALIAALYLAIWRRRVRRLEANLRRPSGAETKGGKTQFLWADKSLQGRLSSAKGSWDILTAEVKIPQNELGEAFQRLRSSMNPTYLKAELFFRDNPDKASELMDDARRRVAALRTELADVRKKEEGPYRQGPKEVGEKKSDPRLDFPAQVIKEAAEAVQYPCGQPWSQVERLLSGAESLLRAYKVSHGMDPPKVRVDAASSTKVVGDGGDQVDTADASKRRQQNS